MDFIDPSILTYAERHSKPEPELLFELNRYTHTSMLRPRMLSGHLQGRFLSMISCLMRPQYVLDIGTFTGYSALCLAEGLSPDGKLYTLDNNDEAMEVARGFINRSAYAGNIVPLCGDAAESIASLNDTIPHWDIIWIDADKERYSLYYKLCLDKLRPGGLIMADNVLWSGKVADPTESGKDRDTAALREFNEMVNGDQRVENMLLPLRDGIMMARKR